MAKARLDKEFNVIMPHAGAHGSHFAFRTVAKTVTQAKREAAREIGLKTVPKGTKVHVIRTYPNRGSVRRTAKAYRRAGFSKKGRRSEVADMRRGYKKKKNPAAKAVRMIKRPKGWMKVRAIKTVRRGGRTVVLVRKRGR